MATVVAAGESQSGRVARSPRWSPRRCSADGLRKQAARAREQARSKARANARKTVNDRFDAIEAEVCAELARVAAEGLAERLTDQVERASALHHAAALAERSAGLVGRAGAEIPAVGSSDHVLADVARRLQRERYPGRPGADRLLWLGEAWCEDPDGLDERSDVARSRHATAAAIASPGTDPRTPAGLRVRHASTRPAAGDGATWLAETRRSSRTTTRPCACSTRWRAQTGHG